VLRGRAKRSPLWVAVLEAAKEWGVPPWVIEEQASEEWWERWRVLREETMVYQERRAKRANEKAMMDG